MDADVELDCRGMVCPLPIIRLANNLGDVAVGATMAVVADDPGARREGGVGGGWRGLDSRGSDLPDDGVPRFLVRRLR